MTWQLAFMSDQAESITILINSESVSIPNMGSGGKTWVSADGTCRATLPAAFKDLTRIKVDAHAKPEDKDAIVLVIWEREVKKLMKFDDNEAQDVKNDQGTGIMERAFTSVLDRIPEKPTGIRLLERSESPLIVEEYVAR